MQLTITLPHEEPVLSEARKSAILRAIVNGLYGVGCGVVSVYFPDGDTNDCDAPIYERSPDVTC